MILSKPGGIDYQPFRDVDSIVAATAEAQPDLLIVDSVQTIEAREVGGSAGGAAQVRECAARLVHAAKESGVPVVLIGHVTKDGGIAGPKLLEHTVDVVLYLEGDLDPRAQGASQPEEPLWRHPPDRSLRDG